MDSLIVYPDGTAQPGVEIPVANGFVSRCVSAISDYNIPDAQDAAKLLNAAVQHGGFLARLAGRESAIVSSNSCSELEIADARARGDFYVDANGFGYVLRLREWLDRVQKRDGYMQDKLPRPEADEGAVPFDAGFRCAMRLLGCEHRCEHLMATEDYPVLRSAGLLNAALAAAQEGAK